MVTVQPRKQRRSAANAPWHRRLKMLAAHVDPALRKKSDWKIPRAVSVRQGDEVYIARGSFRGRRGKILSLNLNDGTVVVEGVKIKRRDEKEVERPIHPSNLIIVSFNESDPRRRERLRGER